MNRVAPLPCVGSLRAGTVITSLAQAVEECLCNALDAGATEVHVELSVGALGFKVTDNGVGISPESLKELPCRGATSKLRSVAQLEAGVGTLGFRGEAVAALCDVAAVELTSRAARSFETWTLVVAGGRVAKRGLALEQRSRQGTVVHVRDLFHNQPVKRRALLSAGAQREADRCRDAIFRLALIRPQITFTLFDKDRKSFLLRLIQDRSLQQGVAEVFGQPSPGALVELPGAMHGGVAVSGFAVLPPHGHANASRQFVYVNGRPVRAGAVCKAVDTLFAQQYKANAQLTGGQGGELVSNRKLGSRHAQFLLQIRCSPAGYDVSSEPDKTEVEFRDWEPVLAATKLAVLRGWRPALTLAGLKQLEQLEQQVGAGGGVAQQYAVTVVPTDPTAGGRGSGGSFRDWVASQSEALPLSALLEANRPSLQLEQAAAKEGRHSGRYCGGAASGSGGGRGERRSAAARPPAVAGVKHTLMSRLVRFTGLEGPSSGSGGGGGGGLGTSPAADAGSSGGQAIKRARAEAAWQPLGASAGLGSEAPLRDSGMDPEAAFCPEEGRHAQPERLQSSPSSDGGMDQLIGSWRPLPAAQLAAISTAAAVCSSWAPQHRQQPSQQQQWQPTRPQGPTLSQAEQRLVASVAYTKPVARPERPSSAPPHAKQRSRAVHTNPNNSLQAARGPAGAASQQQQQLQEGQRGVDTVSGVASKLPAGRQAIGAQHGPASSRAFPWRQQKAAGSGQQQRQPSSNRAIKQPPRGRGLGHQPAAVAPSAAHQAEAFRSGPTLGASLPKASPALHQQPPAAIPSFLQPGAGLEGLLTSWRGPGLDAQRPAGGEDMLRLEVVERDVFAQLKPAAISRQQLHAARALSQVDTKFVPIVCGQVLALVDQHAADERVQLERLRDQLVGAGARPLQRRALALSPPQPLALTQAETQLLETYHEKVWVWGWEWRPSGGTGAGFVLTHVPLVLGTVLTATDMKLYLHHLQDTCGAGGLPAGVVRVLNSKACRGAIMFGDELLPAQCQALVDDLKQTQLFNSCAHGRPTTAPLVDIQSLRRALQLRASSRRLGDSKGTDRPHSLAGLASRLRQFVGSC